MRKIGSDSIFPLRSPFWQRVNPPSCKHGDFVLEMLASQGPCLVFFQMAATSAPPSSGLNNSSHALIPCRRLNPGTQIVIASGEISPNTVRLTACQAENTIAGGVG